mmetsp:Transcript_25945/g.29663  ORF Transcript_25945/g.29663 Transcript_25945/m.29663 type:complete len:594 (+) Transcript_25945:44-1825(+)
MKDVTKNTMTYDAYLTDTKNDSIIDNPCWGGQETKHHNLEYLLSLVETGKFSTNQTKIDASLLIEKSSLSTVSTVSSVILKDQKIQNRILRINNIVLYDDKNYLVINKPPDLRMDGVHPATVHKLVTYMYPPPSLSSRIKEDDSKDTGASYETKNTRQLIQAISKLSKHSDLKDNIIRPTHQLDYATSGVLLLAKSRKMAAIACKAFEERTTCKQYLALVEGNVYVSLQKWIPYLNKNQEQIFQQWKNGTLENNYRKERLLVTGGTGRKKQNTFLGYMPTHSVFTKWKGIRQRKRKRETDERGNDEFDANDNTDDNIFSDKDKIFLNSNSVISKEEEENLLNNSWKDVKRNTNKKHKLYFESLAKEFNDILRQENDRKNMKDDTDKSNMKSSCLSEKLPTVFRVHGEDEDSFYVQAALAEKDDNFGVIVHSNSINDITQRMTNDADKVPLSQYTASDVESLEFKPCITKCVVNQVGILGDGHKESEVTKMLLSPWTGRRHQLRLHMAIIGHYIMGDVTYSPCHDSHQMKQLGRLDCERMCLHAHTLELPLQGGQIKKFIAPDPFLLESDSQNGRFCIGEFRDKVTTSKCMVHV